MLRSAVLLLLLSTIAGHAADALAPVRAVTDLMVARWAAEAASSDDYFDAPWLGRLYSADFAAAYRAASRFPAYDTETGEGSPFDYDPLQGGQDGCPIRDLAMEIEAERADGADVRVTFKPFDCEGFDESSRNFVAERRFVVVTEDGRPVIDDIVDLSNEIDTVSMKTTLRQIATQEP